MNQILEYSPNKNSGGSSSSSDKIVRIFALILIVFALCFIVVGGYGFIKKNKPADDVKQAPVEAKITVEELETTATIKVSHDKAIEKVIYSWDNGKETIDKGNGSSEKEIEVMLPAGTHTLNIKVVDVDGVETSYKKTITSESGTDIISPVIDIKVEGKKIKVVATDETEIAYVTYKWNDDEEIVVEETDEEKKKIEFEIDILKGHNDLTITAVDANQRTTTENKAFAGVTKPEIKITVAADKKTVNILCTHENGLKEVKLVVNGEEFGVDLGDGNPKDAFIENYELPEGNTTIKVIASSVDETNTEVTEEIIPDEPEPENPEEHMNENIEINIVKSDDNKSALISTSYVEGIKEFRLNVNDLDYDVTIPEGETSIALEPLPLLEGNNRITVTVVGINDTVNTKVEELYYGE